MGGKNNDKDGDKASLEFHSHNDERPRTSLPQANTKLTSRSITRIVTSVTRRRRAIKPRIFNKGG